MSSRSVADSITRSQGPIVARSGARWSRARAASRSSAVIKPRATCRPRFFSMVAKPRSSASSLRSFSQTSKPASAKTWAMPLPIWPAPMTPTLLMSMLTPRPRHCSQAALSVALPHCKARTFPHSEGAAERQVERLHARIVIARAGIRLVAQREASPPAAADRPVDLELRAEHREVAPEVVARAFVVDADHGAADQPEARTERNCRHESASTPEVAIRVGLGSEAVTDIGAGEFGKRSRPVFDEPRGSCPFATVANLVDSKADHQLLRHGRHRRQQARREDGRTHHCYHC